MQVRTDDAEPIKITREIPLPWLIACVLAMAGQAVLMWAGQREQAAAISQLSVQLAEQTKLIGTLSEKVGVSNIKDVEHDMKLADHERRLQSLELSGRNK